MAELISIIVTTYNREDALDVVLRGLAQQTDRHFEIIVADDGSGPATKRVVEQWAQRLPAPIFHVWHEDQGFRAAEIRNRAVVKSAGKICVFLDGDCIPRPNFVAAHRLLAEDGWFVTGNRILLGPGMTSRILREHLRPESWTTAEIFATWMQGHGNRLMPALSLPLGPLRKLHARAWQGARSCNLAIRRQDFLAVDGFDATFSGWGLEDSDIIIRLIRNGTLRKDGRFATGVFHLWHPENDRSHLADNQTRLMEVIQNTRIPALRGVSTLAPVMERGHG